MIIFHCAFEDCQAQRPNDGVRQLANREVLVVPPKGWQVTSDGRVFCPYHRSPPIKGSS